jgi:hypothetical protein
MNGYNVILNSCQTSDMVRLGFLYRVQNFTYRDDLKMHIMQSDQWKAIIHDNDHHTEGVSVVALTGLEDLNTVMELHKELKR